MVEYKKYGRNSLQTRLERSRRYRSRGGNHQDAMSVGDESFTSVDNVSMTSTSIDPSIQSKHEDSIKQESSKEESIEATSTQGDTPNLAESTCHLSQDKHFSRRRLTHRSLKSKRNGPPQSTPTKGEVLATLSSPERGEVHATLSSPERKIDQTVQKPSSTLQVATSKEATKHIPDADAIKKAVPRRIHTQEPKNLDQDAPSRRYSPKNQVPSPCESVAYQASAMEEDCEMKEKSGSMLHPPTRKKPATFFSNRGPSALQNWKQREQKEKKLDCSAGASSNSWPRSAVEAAIPKAAPGRSDVKHGSDASYRCSLGGAGHDKDTPDQESSTKPKDSRKTQVHLTTKSTQSGKVSTGLTQTPQTTQHHRQRHSTGGSNTSLHYHRSSQNHPPEGNMYKNILKPVQRDPDRSSDPTQETAFGGVIETPKRIKVSSLLASFDSRQNQPLMPMNCTDPRVRHSLPFSAGASVPKKTSNDSAGQAQKQLDGDDMELSRKVVVRPPSRNLLSTSKKIAVASLQPIDAGSIRSRESTSNSPTSGGVAEIHRTVTGKNDKEPAPEVHVDDEEPENLKTKKLLPTQQYYKASWRVQTNDFGAEKKYLETTGIDGGTLSPRQSVLSSWNQRYRKQIQASSNTIGITPNDSSSTENYGTHQPNLAISSEPNRLETFEDQDVKREQPHVSQNTLDIEREQVTQKIPEVLQEPSHIVYTGRAQRQNEMAAKASIFCTWQQRERKHQPLATVSARRFESSVEAQEVGDTHEISMKAPVSETNMLGENKDAPRTRSSAQKKILDSGNYLSQGKATDIVRKQIGFLTSRRSLSKNEMSRDHHPSLDSAEELNCGNDSRSSDAKDTIAGSSSDTKDTIAGSSSQESLGRAAGNYENVAGVVKSSWSDTSSENQEVPPSQQNEKKTAKRDDQHSASRPWGKGTKHSVFQSWQLRSTETKKVSQLQEETLEKYPSQSRSRDETKITVVEQDSGRVLPFNCTETLDEKKSEDLSVNEDRILGVDYEDEPVPNRTRTSSSIDHDNSFDQKSSSRQLIYDDDSYISDGESESEKVDTVSDEISPIPPKPTTVRSQESSTDLKKIDSGEISLYVEDELAKKVKKTAFSKIETDEKVENLKDGVNVNSTFQESLSSKQGSLRIHPSPKDTRKYRLGYFGDESLSTTRGSQNDTVNFVGGQGQNTIETPPKVTKTSRRSRAVLDIWAVSSVSEDEQDDDIQFDEADEWLARDPDINDDAIDDSSILSEPNQHAKKSFKASFLSSAKIARRAFTSDDATTTFDNSHSRKPAGNDARVTEREDVGIPVLDNPNTWNMAKQTPVSKMDRKMNSCQEVPFDPFQDEADDGTKEDIPAELFSPGQDPFMTEESFSPLDWSSPRGTTAQHIGYYNSPDSRLEI